MIIGKVLLAQAGLGKVDCKQRAKRLILVFPSGWFSYSGPLLSYYHFFLCGGLFVPLLRTADTSDETKHSSLFFTETFVNRETNHLKLMETVFL